jgi:hypothetical protein
MHVKHRRCFIVCLEAVKKDGMMLKFINKQTKRNMFASSKTQWKFIEICEGPIS